MVRVLSTRKARLQAGKEWFAMLKLLSFDFCPLPFDLLFSFCRAGKERLAALELLPFDFCLLTFDLLFQPELVLV